jgi:hypothetical protein
MKKPGTVSSRVGAGLLGLLWPQSFIRIAATGSFATTSE